MWESLTQDDLGLLRLKVIFTKVPFHGEKEVLILPRKLVRDAILTAHQQAAHRAAKETVRRLKPYCYFPNMLSTVERVLSFCVECQTKTTRLPDQRHTLASTIPGYPWQILSIDIVGPFPSSKPGGFTHLFTIKDTFTKWIEGFPIKKTDTITLIDILQKEIFSRFGKCERIHSDQGTQFTSNVFQEMGEALKIQTTCTPAYNPKSNPVERAHRDIKSALMALSLNKPEELSLIHI